MTKGGELPDEKIPFYPLRNLISIRKGFVSERKDMINWKYPLWAEPYF
jgi:hypothetical protein